MDKYDFIIGFCGMIYLFTDPKENDSLYPSTNTAGCTRYDILMIDAVRYDLF